MSSRKSSLDEMPSSLDNEDGSHHVHFDNNPRVSLEDLDLLPTKDATPTNDLSAGETSTTHVWTFLQGFCKL